MPLAAILGFAALALTLIAVPGPDWAYLLAAGVRGRVVLPAVAGILTGYTLITLAVVVGVGSLVTRVPHALTAVTVVGSCYLAYLGLRTLRAPAHLAAASSAAATPRDYVVRGVGVSALNPKGLLMFLAILPQFARTSGSWPLPAQFAALGAVFIAIAGVFYSVLGVASERVLGARPQVAQVTTKLAGVAMIVVGGVLLAEQLR
jgi:threonine/homoserine/homoserine lactone efflux protein